MYTRLFPGILLLLLLGLLPSCNTDNGTGVAPPPATDGVISAYINNEYWSLSTGYAELVPTANLQIYCSGTYGSMSITIYPYNGMSTYTLDGLTKISYTEAGVQYNSIRGQIQITTDAPDYIEGRFNAELISTTGSTSLVFSDGQFSIDKY